MKTLDDITRGCKKKVHCQRKPESKVTKCQECRKSVEIGEKYFAIGLRASTAYERFYSRQGCIWYKYCEKCA